MRKDKQVYFIDTNIFLRFFVKEDPVSYQECARVIKSILNNQITAYTSILVLSEIFFVLNSYYKITKKDSLKILNTLTELASLRYVENYQPQTALKLFADYNVKFVDCLIASIKPVYQRKITLISYDTDFDKLKIKRIAPGTLIN